MKKILCMTLMLLMLLSCLSVRAEAAVWDFDTTDFRLNGYQGEGGAVVVPDTIDGCTVDIFGMYLFNDADAVTSLTLPATLKQVEDSAVAFCDSLTELIIPEGIQVIGDNCFVGNPGLTELVIPASVRYIGASSFGSNENLNKVTFLGECPVFAGAALDWIADDAEIYVPDDQYDAYAAALTEAECYSTILPSGANAVVYELTTDPSLFEFDAETGTITRFAGFDACVEVPAEIGGAAVKAIGDEAFGDNNYVCMVTLPEGLESIGASAFESCDTLLHVDFPSTLKHIGSRAFYAGYHGRALNLPAVETIGDEAFGRCVRLTDPVYLPEGLKRIGNSAFDGCGWLGEVYLPASVETIGERAFADSGMNYLVFNGLKLPEIADTAFENCWYLSDIDLHTKTTKQEMLDMQAKVDALGLTCRVWRMQNPDVDYVNDGLDTYENGVLTAYTGEQTHLRPWDTYDDVTVTALGDGVFANNTYIEYFAVPYNDEFTTIGAEAFANSSLMQIDLFDSVTTINGGAFRNCANLTELTLPESVEFVGVEALYGCTGLQKLTVLCDPTVLPEDLFDVWPEGLEIYAGENATDEQLMYLTSIAGRPFYQPVTRIGEPLPELTASPYEALPAEDFWYDTEFARLDNYQGYELNLVLPSTAEDTMLTMVGGSMMGRAMFGDNYEQELPVVSVVIPQGYTEIPPFAFQNCDTLETVICYAPLELLPDSAFSGCTSLREVVFVNGVHSIGEYVFDGCPNLETVYLGQYVENVGEFAFMDQFGDTVWSMEQCITDPALLPDIDSMLEAVKREPMAEPEPEATPEPAVPVGEEGKDFFGLWIGTEMDMGGEVMKLSDWEIIMNVLLLEDGRMIAMDEEVTDWSALDGFEAPGWRVENGVAIGDTCTMTILEDGRLLMDEDGMQIYFERSDVQIDVPSAPAQPETPVQPEAPAVPEAPAAPETSADASGRTEIKFVCESADVSGFNMAASMLGGEYSMIFREDGNAVFVVVGNEMPGVTWKQLDSGNFQIDFYGTPMEIVWTDKGFDMNYMDSMLMHFVPAN
ncbi:MAG: leucine-rich repeat domain-containing protein [Clostridia bacterium]|nr:leucine-rich repeat domain-containing protein [Clostridia bacterium]